MLTLTRQVPAQSLKNVTRSATLLFGDAMTFQQWLKKCESLDSKQLRQELEMLPIETLDQWAFGVKSGDKILLDPGCITIVYQGDAENAREDMRTALKAGVYRNERDWAKHMSFELPIEIDVADEHVLTSRKRYTLDLSDGHHRHLAASILDQPLPAIIDISAKPIEVLLAPRQNKSLSDLRKCLSRFYYFSGRPPSRENTRKK